MVCVVSGPPGSGKTTYVQQHRERGDLVVDLDYLLSAISFLDVHDKPEELLPFAIAARNAIYDRLAVHSRVKTAWIITSSEDDARELCQRFKARHIPLVIDEFERQRRLLTR